MAQKVLKSLLRISFLLELLLVQKVRLRRGAGFTNKDVDQLINHEAFIHVATTLNGRQQTNVKILGAKTGSITKTQEGLAVFSEFITGCIDVNRMYRISDRYCYSNGYRWSVY